MKAFAEVTAALMALGLMMVTPAWAIDITGTWKDAGSQCKSLTASGEKVRFKKKDVDLGELYIHQDGSELGAVSGTAPLKGTVHDELKNPDKGQGLLVGCFSLVDSAFTMASVKTYPVNRKGYSGTIRGSVWFGSPGEIRVCKVTFKRTSTADPGPVTCP